MCAEPRDLWCYDDAHELKRKWQDEDAWNQGMYFVEAIMCTIGNIGAKGELNKYPENPHSHLISESKERDSNSAEIIAVYEMKQRTKLLEKSGLKQSPS